MNGIDLAQGRDRRWVFVNEVKKFRVPYNAWNFDKLKTDCFLKKDSAPWRQAGRQQADR